MKYKILRLVRIIFYILPKYRYMYYLLHTYIYLHYIQHIFKYQINVNCVLTNQNYFSTINIILLYNGAATITLLCMLRVTM